MSHRGLILVRILLVMALGTMGACGPQGVDATDNRSKLSLIAPDGHERIISYRSHVYVASTAGEKLVQEAIARALRNLIGPLRAKKIAFSSRNFLQSTTVDWSSRETLKVWDDTQPAAEVRSVDRISFRFTGRVVASKDLDTHDVVKTQVLKGDYAQHATSLVTPCSEDPDIDEEDLWYYFDPEKSPCQKLIRSEAESVTQAQLKVARAPFAGEKWVSRQLVTRIFAEAILTLGAPAMDDQERSPEYGRLFGLTEGKDRLLVYLLSGVDLSSQLVNDRFLLEYARVLAHFLEKSPHGEAHPLPSTFFDRARTLPGRWPQHVGYPTIFDWLQNEHHIPNRLALTRAQLLTVKDWARSHLAERWITWKFPLTLSDHRALSKSATRPLTLEIRSFLGTESGSDETKQAAISRYREALREADIIIYNGHSHLGQGALDPSHYRPEDFAPHYQMMFINSCSSFQYYGHDFKELKPGGSQNLDIIANGLKSPIARSGEVVFAFMEGILALKPYPKLLDGMQSAECCAFDVLRLADGELDNNFSLEATPFSISWIK